MLLISQILQKPIRSALPSRGLGRLTSLHSSRIRRVDPHQCHSFATHHLTQQHSQQQAAAQRIPSLLCSSSRVRSFSHATSSALLLNNQVRSIGFSSIPRLTLTAFRFPAFIAGTTVAGVTVANNKLTEWTDKGSALFFNGVSEAQKFLRLVEEQADGLDISIPEVHLRVPSAIKDFLASVNSKGQEEHSTNHALSSSEKVNDSESNNGGKDDGGGGGGDNNNGTTAAAAAALLAATLTSDEDEDDHKRKTKKKNTNEGHSISANDEQLMMLTKKLIEIRSILLSIDHNETLKLPSIVVVGSQSSGKSSVLEAIVGHEFLPKGTNMVTRRPIELTLVHTPGQDEEYGEFPQLGLGKMHDFNKVQKTLLDMNMAVTDTECVSDEPIELRIYSPNVPDLTLIDLPGYIQIANRNQPQLLKTKIEELCEKYIREPNIILAVCAANVDLANSPALRASRKLDPLGLRTIGVITKMDLVPPEMGTAILRNGDYPLHLGYIGVVCKSPDNHDGSNMTNALIKNEASFFHNHHSYNQRDIQVGTATLRQKLMTVLEQSMGRSLYSIVDAVQRELEETRYQFKVQYNDRRVTAESYMAETMDGLKHNFKDFSYRFGKPQVRHEVRTMLEQRVLDICAEHYWSDGKIADLNKASPDDLYWLYKIDLASAALTKSGIGRSTTQLVVDVLMSNMERLANAEQFQYHPETRKQILNFTNEILRSKFLTTSDQVENTIKPYKYEVEITDAEWTDGVKRSVVILEKELELCDQMTNNIKNSIGKSKLKSAIRHVLDSDREDNRRQDRIQQLAEEGNGFSEELVIHADDDDDDVKPFYNPRLVEKAKEVLFLRDRAMILKYRIAALKSRQCKSSDNKQYCPEAFLNIVAEKLTYTAVMFIQVELLNEFFFQFPREVDDRLVYQMNRKQIQQFAKENPPIQKHLSLMERKAKLEEVMDKLNYLVKRQADRHEKPRSHYN